MRTPWRTSGRRTASAERAGGSPGNSPGNSVDDAAGDGTAAAAHRTTAVLALRPRSALVLTLASIVGVAAFGWPLLAAPRQGLEHAGDAPWIFLGLLPLLLAVVLAELAEGGMDAKAVALLGVLAAVGSVLRPLGPGIAGLEPTLFLIVLAARVLGRGFGFVLGALTYFASGLLTAGVGPWLPFQMIGAAWVGFGAACLPSRLRGRAELAALAAYTTVAALLYGLLLNLWTWPFLTFLDGTGVAFVPGEPVTENLRRLVAFTLATSLGYDVPRAVLNTLLVVVAGPAVLLALRRASRRAAFGAAVTFAAPVMAEPAAGTPATGEAGR